MKRLLQKIFIDVIVCLLLIGNTNGQRQMEKLNRGLVAVRTSSNTVFISWRLFGTDAASTSFNLYKGTTKINSSPITGATNYVDNTTIDDTYSVKPIVNGVEQASSESASVWSQFYKEIPLNVPAGGTTPDGVVYTYSPNDCSVGDVDGDGEYEIIVKWDPSNSKDNSQSGYTGNVYLDAYKLNGTFLWRIDLGKNIRAGAHYTQFLVYDFDGDGKAEIVCKTAPGTKDGLGNYLTGAAAGTDNNADYRNSSGYILTGPEYLTIFNGQTGKELQTINYEVARGTVSSWGDSYGNRVDRFLACVAYLDGKTPSLVMCRGYYTRCYLVAYKWNGSSLTKQWAFDSNTSGNSGYAGQGCHSLCVGDVDGDGFDEIVYGACTIDHNGTGKYTTGLGHGDALHLGDFDPDRPGLEVWQAHEDGATNGGIGATFRDANTGTVIWNFAASSDVGRGMAADITGTTRGIECWAAGSGLYSCTGSVISTSQPTSDNFGIWWDGDDLRELLDGTKLDKYGSGRLVTLYNYDGATACNGTKNTPNLQADILGDWREEVILHSYDNTKLIIFTTTTPTTRRLYTLMHNEMYRLGIAWQNVGYNQPPDVSYYLGNGMATPPVPPIQEAKLLWKGDNTANVWDINSTANWLNHGSASVFNQGDTVMFDLFGSNNIPINITGTLMPGYVIVHSPIDYVFNGTGSLSGSMNLLKAGKGTLSFNSIQTYSGSTEVNEGTLLVNDSLRQSAVMVDYQAKIGGSGYIKQGVTLVSGSAIVPGNNNADTLTMYNGLNFPGNITCHFDLSDDTTGKIKSNDLIRVVGDLTISGTNTIQVNPLNGKLAVGTYKLITYTGTFTGDITNLKIAGVYGQQYVVNNAGGVISIRILATRDPALITWAGTGANWDLLTSVNWLLKGQPDVFVSNDTVVFDSTGLAQPIVNLVDVLPVGSVKVETAKNNYTFSGTGSISGTGGITKNGTGLLSILNQNNYTGKTTINNGTLETKYLSNAGVSSSIGATTLTDPSYFVLNNATLKHSGSSVAINRGLTLNGTSDTIVLTTSSNQVTISGLITGTGTLVKTGAGTLTIEAQTNTYSGGTVIKGGTIAFGDDAGNSGGFGSGPVTLDGGALSMLSNASTYTNVTYNLSVPSGSIGTFNTDARSSIYGTLTGSGTLNVYLPGTIDRTIFFADWSAFIGTINISGVSSSTFRIANSYGYAGSTINLNSNVTMYHGGTGTTGGDTVTTIVQLGALSGQSGSVIKDENWIIGANNTDAVFNGIIQGRLITKVGTGSWTLTAANTYTRGTTINGGTLMINNTTGSGTGTGAVTVNSTGTLAGTGIISGAVTVNNGGTIAPGNNAIGRLVINNNLVLASGSTTAVDIKKAPLANDSIRLTGTLTYNGTLSITNLGSTSFAAGDNFKLFKAASYSGSFANILPATPGNGMIWDTTDLRTNGTIRVKSTQVITFDALTAKTYGDAPFTLTATASSGLPVSYTSSDTSVATISGITVTIVGAGTCIITASQSGNTSFSAATDVTQSLTVNKGSQTITFDALSDKALGDASFTLTATASSGLPVTYTSSNTSVVTISDDTVTIIGKGTITITASQSGNSNYDSAQDVQQTLTVTLGTSVLALDVEVVQVYPNPFEGFVNLFFNKDIKELIVEIESSNGIIVFSKTCYNQQTSANLDLSSLPKGMYLLKVIMDDDIIVKKIVKN